MSHHTPHPPDVVLLVEHEPRTRRLLKRILSKETTRVITAGTAVRALQIVSRTSLALVILDENLPDESGTSVLQRLRRIDPGVAVIMVTGFGSIEAVRTAMELGASDYLTRPFDNGNLEHVVHAALTARL